MNTTTTAKRWLAGFVMGAGLGTAIITGGAVASADTAATNTDSAPGPSSGTTIGPVNDGASSRNLQEQVGVPIKKKGIGGIFTVSPNISRAGAQIVGDHCANNTGCPPK